MARAWLFLIGLLGMGGVAYAQSLDPSLLNLRIQAQPEVPPHNGAPKRLAVLPVLIGPSPREPRSSGRHPGDEGRTDLNVGSVFRGVERATVARKLRPMSVDDYFFQDGRELSDRALRCGEDTSCLSEALEAFQADLGLVVIVNASLSPPLLALLLVDASRQRVLADRYEEVDERPLETQIQRATAAVLDDAGFNQSGYLEVLAKPADAVVEVGEGQRPDTGQAHRFTLPPGAYRVRISAPEHDPKELRAEVAPGQVTQLEVQLEQKPTIWASPWLWGGLAAIVVAGAVTAGVLASSGSEGNCVCVFGRGQTAESACLECR